MTNLDANLRVCRGCGCDDDHACVTAEGPCTWALLDVDTPTGICSACAAIISYHPLGMASLGFDDEEEINAILCFANIAPAYRAEALEIIRSLRREQLGARTER